MLAPTQGPYVSHRLVGLLCHTRSSLLSDSLQADIPTILTHTNTGCSWPACHHYPASTKEKSGEVINQTLRLMRNNEGTKFSCESNQDPAFTNLEVIYLRWETVSEENNACEYKGEHNNDPRAQLPACVCGRRDGRSLVTITLGTMRGRVRQSLLHYHYGAGNPKDKEQHHFTESLAMAHKISGFVKWGDSHEQPWFHWPWLCHSNTVGKGLVG